MLVELQAVTADRLPTRQMAATAADLGLGANAVETALRVALAAIEARTGKAILTRGYSWSTRRWQDPVKQVLPIAPVITIDAIAAVPRMGHQRTIDPDQVVLRPDRHRPTVTGRDGHLPTVPDGGCIEIRLTAGYADAWDGVPPELQDAVLRLAGHYLKRRSARQDPMPADVQALIEGHRVVQISGAQP